MPLKVEEIIDEYLHTPDIQTRKNAVIALVAAGTETAIKRLVDVSLSDPDYDIRTHAAWQVLGLEEEALQIACRELWAEVHNNRRRVAALKVLCDIKAYGADVHRPPERFLKRMQLADAVRSSLYKTGWPAFTRAFGPSTLGAVIAFAIYCLQMALTVGFSDSNAWGVIILIPLDVLMFSIIAMRSVPFRYQIDRLAGISASLIAVFILAYPTSELGGAGGQAMGISDFNNYVYFMSLATFGLFCAAVRIGTFISYGVVNGKWANRWLQTLAGGGSGILFLVVCYQVLMRFDPWWAGLLGDCGSVYIGFGFGLAYVFAALDTQDPINSKLRRSKLSKISTNLLAALAVFSFLFAGLFCIGRSGYVSTRAADSFKVFIAADKWGGARVRQDADTYAERSKLH